MIRIRREVRRTFNVTVGSPEKSSADFLKRALIVGKNTLMSFKASASVIVGMDEEEEEVALPQ